MQTKRSQAFPNFSVLISIYPGAQPEFLNQALTSVEQQTVPPTEIVLVEDGIVGKELNQIVRQHRTQFDGTFKVVISQQNKGLGLAMRLGVFCK